MVGSLAFFQLCILLFQGFLDGFDLFCEVTSFFPDGLNGFGDCIVLFFCLSDGRLLLFFLSFQRKHSLADSGLPDIQLLHHGIKTLRFTFGVGTGVEDFDNLVFSIFYCLGTFFDVALDVIQFFLFIGKLSADFAKLCLQICPLLFQFLSVCGFFLRVFLNGQKAAAIMAVILLTCKDLFMKDIDLTGKLLLADGTVPAFLPESIHTLVQLFQRFFQAFILVFGSAVGVFCLL